MKKISIIAVLLLTLTSCEKFLEEDARSEISADGFFRSADDAYSAVNILYRKGFPTYYNAPVNGASRLMTGGFLAGLYDNQYKGEFVVRAQAVSVNAGLDNAQLQDVWQSSYEAIVRNANFALKYLPEAPGLTNNQRVQLIAEAKFFRALNYFFLVKTFGAVPLITDTYESLTDVYVRRATIAKVYDQIVNDLTSALESGNLSDRPMPENNFRISKGSVAALLADVYLNMAGYPLNDQSKYADAAAVAKSLIENNSYGLIQHQDMGSGSAYNRLRTSDNEKEYLYTIEFDDVVAAGSGYTMYCFPQEAATWGEFPNYGMANLGYDPVGLLHRVYHQDDDLRYQEKQYFHRSYTQVNGPNAGTVRVFGRPNPFFWWEEKAALETGVSSKDRVHYRLTEMYLIAAEAIAESQGVTDEAAGYLARIQHRASMTRSFESIKASLMTLPAQAFIEEVWREKIREFIFEYKIWNDITRTQAYPAVDAAGNFGFVPLIGATNPFGGTYREDNLYLPIGEIEMQRNPASAEPPL